MGEQAEDPDQGRCLGIRCSIWARAQRRREITHHLRGGGSHNIGWGALRWQEMVSTDEVLFGKLRELRYLPKKIMIVFIFSSIFAFFSNSCVFSPNPPPFFSNFSYPPRFGARSLLRTHVRPFGLYKRSYQPAHPPPPPAHPSPPAHPPGPHPAPPGPSHPAPPGPPPHPSRPAIPTPPGPARPATPSPPGPTRARGRRWQRQDGPAHVRRGGGVRAARVRRAAA